MRMSEGIMTYACLRFSHGHMSSLSVAWQTLDNPPHALSWANPLHKIGWEESNSVPTLTLKVTANNTIRRHFKRYGWLQLDLGDAFSSEFIPINECEMCYYNYEYHKH